MEITKESFETKVLDKNASWWSCDAVSQKNKAFQKISGIDRYRSSCNFISRCHLQWPSIACSLAIFFLRLYYTEELLCCRLSSQHTQVLDVAVFQGSSPVNQVRLAWKKLMNFCVLYMHNLACQIPWLGLFGTSLEIYTCQSIRVSGPK